MNLTVYAEKRRKQLHNFWNHIHFHPTDAIEDDWGQRILNRVRDDHAAETVRMYAMLEDIVSMAPDGTLQYDFTENDVRMDYMAGMGFTLLISYNFIPACIACDPDETNSNSKNTKRYKGKLIITSPPRDYALWEDICRTYTEHIVERYGLERVSGWYLQCFNEPDIPNYWMKEETDIQVRCAAYCRLYDAFERGILAVSDKLCLGGPALACRMDFLELYLNHVRENGKRLDFLCFHTYGTHPALINSGELPISASNSVERILDVKRLAVQYGFADVPFIIDEWGASSCGFFNREECPNLIFRETEIFSAFFIKMITFYEKRELPIEKLLICLSGQHEMKTDFSGFRGFFTLNFYPKPIYNAFVLAAKLGNSKLLYDNPDNENLTVLPTVSPDGRIAVLLSYSSEHFDTELPVIPLEITFADVTEERDVKLWLIDREHANSYRAHERLGSPMEPTEDQIREITAAGTLSFDHCRMSGSLSVTMQNNSVLLIEVMP